MARGACPVVGLEIAEHQQSAIDAMVAAKKGVTPIRVFWVIDHAGYRAMITSLPRLAREGCFTLLAIDDALAADRLGTRRPNKT